MPLPLILGIGAAIAGATGVGAAVHGAAKMKKSNDQVKRASNQLEGSKSIFEEQNNAAIKVIDSIGKEELEILNSFEEFANQIERIQNRPEFVEYKKEGISIPKYNCEEIKKVSVGAGVLLGGLGGAAVGTAGGFAAAGATTSAVMALGTASTGTAIASLSGAAATNATLAALGGGAIAAGGGGIALGTTILGMTTMGIGLLIGGIIFEVSGSKVSEKADTAVAKMQDSKKEIDKINSYLILLNDTATTFKKTLSALRRKYHSYYLKLKKLVELEGKTDWNEYTEDEKLVVENTVLLVGMLYKMCQVKLVLKNDDPKELNTVNTMEVLSVTGEMRNVLAEKFDVQVI